MRFNPDNNWYWWILCIIVVILCLPVLTVKYLPLMDYPNHLARAYILYNYNDVSFFHSTFERNYILTPNLASDIVIVFLLYFVNILVAGKLFLLLTVLLFVTGCHRLGRAIHGRPAWLALVCCFFIYNSMLLIGLVNYIFALGIFCITLAEWLVWQKEKNRIRFLFVIVLVMLSYLSHISSFIFLFLTITLLSVWDYTKQKENLRTLLINFVPFILPSVCFILFFNSSVRTAGFQWNSIRGKMIGTLSLLLSYDYTIDLILLCIFLLVCIVFFFHAKEISINRQICAAGCVLLLFYFFSPKTLFSMGMADARFFPPAVLLLTLCFHFRISKYAGQILLSACLLIFIFHLISIWNTWLVLDKKISAEVDQLQQLPENVKIYPIVSLPAGKEKDKTERTFVHIVQYATIYRHDSVPTLFSLEGNESISFRVKPKFAALSDYSPEQCIRFIGGYDYVWSYGIDSVCYRLLQNRCTIFREKDGFILWKINNGHP